MRLIILFILSISCVAEEPDDKKSRIYELAKERQEKQKAKDKQFSENIRKLSLMKVSYDKISFKHDLEKLYIALHTLQDIDRVEDIYFTRFYKKLNSLKENHLKWNENELTQVSKFHITLFALLKNKKLSDKYGNLLIEQVHDSRILLERRDQLLNSKK